MIRRGAEALSEIFGSSVRGTSPHSVDLFSSNILGATRRHETFTAELGDSLPFPSVIIPDAGDVEEFFATIATYYPNHSPISAWVHVLSTETADVFPRQPKQVRPRSLSDGSLFRKACMGAAIGEATLTGLEIHDTGSAPPYSACKRTLAFSLCRATTLYEAAVRADSIAARWTRLRKLTGLSASSTITEAVVYAHSIAWRSSAASRLSTVDSTVDEGLRQLAHGKDGNGDLLARVLIRLYPATERHFQDLQGAYDGRMSAFTRLVQAIQSDSRGVRNDEIAVAFICNRILPGSFAHTGILTHLAEFFPAALVWYGLFSALSTAPHENPALIAKLERDLLDSFSFEQRPRCDISLEELEVLLRTSLRPETVKPSQQRALLVALLPGVDIYTRFGSDAEASIEKNRRDIEIKDLHDRVSRLLEEALYSLNKSSLDKGQATKSSNRRPRRDR